MQFAFPDHQTLSVRAVLRREGGGGGVTSCETFCNGDWVGLGAPGGGLGGGMGREAEEGAGEPEGGLGGGMLGFELFAFS